MKLADTEDAQLCYEHQPRAGAPALLMLNALGTNLELWDEQLAALGERYELVRFDARGHGKSSAGSRRELTVEQLGRDALAVLDACGIARAHLCGLSLGGMTAMQIATRWPDRVLKLALCSTSAYMPPRENWQSRIDTVLAQGMGPFVEPTLGRWFTPVFHAAQPAQVDRIRTMLGSTDPKGYAACSAAIRDMDQREAIKAITARTLVIGGTKDPGTDPTHAALIAGSIPDSKLVMLDAAHLANIERADEFTAALLEFLAA